jgi:hypothetical protein
VHAEVDAFCATTGLLDREEARRLTERRAPQAWNLLNLALWHKEFIA